MTEEEEMKLRWNRYRARQFGMGMMGMMGMNGMMGQPEMFGMPGGGFGFFRGFGDFDMMYDVPRYPMNEEWMSGQDFREGRFRYIPGVPIYPERFMRWRAPVRIGVSINVLGKNR